MTTREQSIDGPVLPDPQSLDEALDQVADLYVAALDARDRDDTADVHTRPA